MLGFYLVDRVCLCLNELLILTGGVFSGSLWNLGMAITRFLLIAIPTNIIHTHAHAYLTKYLLINIINTSAFHIVTLRSTCVNLRQKLKTLNVNFSPFIKTILRLSFQLNLTLPLSKYNKLNHITAQRVIFWRPFFRS